MVVTYAPLDTRPCPRPAGFPAPDGGARRPAGLRSQTAGQRQLVLDGASRAKETHLALEIPTRTLEDGPGRASSPPPPAAAPSPANGAPARPFLESAPRWTTRSPWSRRPRAAARASSPCRSPASRTRPSLDLRGPEGRPARAARADRHRPARSSPSRAPARRWRSGEDAVPGAGGDLAGGCPTWSRWPRGSTAASRRTGRSPTAPARRCKEARDRARGLHRSIKGRLDELLHDEKLPAQPARGLLHAAQRPLRGAGARAAPRRGARASSTTPASPGRRSSSSRRR